MNVLIVDDSKAMRIIVGRALREMGVPGSPYLEAANGKAALELIAGQPVDLIVSDLNMPEMSGMELLRAIRQSGNETPFGFVTSEASALLLEEAVAAGARFVLTKPFTAAHLSEHLAPILSGLGCGAHRVESDEPTHKTGSSFPQGVRVAETLKELLRRDVAARPCPPVIRPKEGWMVAEYQWVGHAAVAGYALSDFVLAVSVGAALTLMPHSAVQEAIKARSMGTVIGDNFNEVLNVMSRFFDHNDISRVRLGRIYRPDEKLDPEAMRSMLRPAARLDVNIDISGYAGGGLTLLSLPLPPALAAKKPAQFSGVAARGSPVLSGA